MAARKSTKKSGPKRAAKEKPLLLVVRTVTVSPDEVERKKETVRNIGGKRGKDQWYGTERKKKNAVIRTRLQYIEVTKGMFEAGQTEDLIERVLKSQAETFRKKKDRTNQISHSAQFVRGSFVNRHTGRMKASSYVGTTIYAPSVAKIVKKGRGKNARKVKLSEKTIRTKLANSITFLLNDTEKLLNYGLIKIRDARKAKKRSHKKKRTTNREEKNESED